MSERVTRKDVEASARRVARSASALGLASEAHILEIGSQTNGRAWRMFQMSGHSYLPGMSNGYIGWTAREADQHLRGMAEALESMLHPDGCANHWELVMPVRL